MAARCGGVGHLVQQSTRCSPAIGCNIRVDKDNSQSLGTIRAMPTGRDHNGVPWQLRPPVFSVVAVEESVILSGSLVGSSALDCPLY
jgi:hypothetical protein